MKKINLFILSAALLVPLFGCAEKDEPSQSESVKVTGVTLNETTKTLEVGEFFQLVAIVSPDNASGKWVIGYCDKSKSSIRVNSFKCDYYRVCLVKRREIHSADSTTASFITAIKWCFSTAATHGVTVILLIFAKKTPVMRVVIQRVSSASVTINGKVWSSIQKGLLVLLGVSPDDGHVTICIDSRNRL